MTQTQTVERNNLANQNEEEKDDGEIDDVAQYLFDRGMVFELNRRFFHPIGLSLSVEFADPKNPYLRLHEHLDKPITTFNVATFNKGGDKWNKWWDEKGIKANHLRKQMLGFTVQNNPDYRKDQHKV